MLLGLVARVLSCSEVCNKSNCGPEPTHCSYGIVKDACDCCSVCAQGPGEVCDGGALQLGTCGDRLKCIPDNPGDSLLPPVKPSPWAPSVPAARGKCIGVSLNGWIQATNGCIKGHNKL